ncbi:MAG: MFS transporter [Legionella sp.]|nr:MFS transporter [Legionella sp.]
MNGSLKIISANVIGTTLEYFDYALYGFSIPIIATLFFPSNSPLNSILLAWSTLIISLLIRPFAAVVLGYYGDRIGRKKILNFTVLMMAFSTILFGLIPTYSQIGIMAPVLLLICRIAQGFAVSAEYNGSCIYLIEMFSNRKSLVASMVVFACGLGVMAASVLTLLFLSSSITYNNHFYLWRVPFIVGGALAGSIGFYLINGIPESQAFLAAKTNNRILKNPFRDLFKSQKSLMLSAMFLSGYCGTATYILTIYLSLYLQTVVGIEMQQALLIVIIGSFIGTLTIPMFGLISDAKGQRNVMLISLIATILLSVPAFFIIQTKSTGIIIMAVSVISVCNAAFCSPFASLIPGLFQPEMRYSGMGISFNFGAALMGGLAPMIITLLTGLTNSALVPGIYMMIFAMLSFVILWRAPVFQETKTRCGYYAKPI